MKKFTFLILILIGISSFAQQKNFIDLPYLETSAKADTLVIPDKIYLNITINEEDTKGRTSLEELENKMNNKLKSLGIDTKKQLFLNDFSSSYKKYFLRKKDVLKSKNYTLIVRDAKKVGDVLLGLEEINISNIFLEKTEYSKMEELKLALISKATLNAKKQAEAMLKPLGQKVGNVIYISNLDNGYSPVNYLQGRAMGLMAKAEGIESSTPIDINFEKISVSANIKATFKID
ncbi:SIMPL domain-containing protein [Weeksellaceae bacterium TAE3-ERU29]|nr:SIMPL domain-containing protein [Weeksellaceae bacterium TAE3-ERU29]